MAERTDEFFVGYAAAMPPRTARLVRRAVAVLIALATLAPLLLALAHSRLAPATFEYGEARRFRGTIRVAPVPVLELAPRAAPSGGEAPSSFLLVAPGKHGAAPLVEEHDGRAVELVGSLVYRGGHTMIEVDPDSITALDPPDAAPIGADVVDLGPVRLRGEIVDTKCHLGVMNPGDGKTHRGCAARCISGGVPPALRVRDGDGRESLHLLVGTNGEQIGRDLLPFVAEPVEIAGRAERRGDLLLLYADPANVRRIGDGG